MSKADWRRTPPATTRMTFWASSPGARNPDSLISMGNSIRSSTADVKELLKHQAAPQKRMEGDVYTGVSVKSGTMTGIMGTFTIGSPAIRWSGRKVESTTRPILGEVVDALNRDPENWTISFSKESIKKLSTSEDQTNVIIIALDDGSSSEFSFRNPSECRAALQRLNSELGHLKKEEESSNSRQKRKQREQGRRRSISFDDVLEDEDGEDDEQDTENINPEQNSGVPFPFKKMPNIHSVMHPPKEETKSVVSHLANNNRESLDELRSLVRAYCSSNSTTSQVTAAAEQIKSMYNYEIGEHTLGAEFNVTDAKWLPANEKKMKQAEMLKKVQKMIEGMKSTSLRERKMIEEETEVSIRSPSKGKRGYEFLCKRTGAEVSANVFERRYLERILKYPVKPEPAVEEAPSSLIIVETNAFDVSVMLMNDENILQQSAAAPDHDSVVVVDCGHRFDLDWVVPEAEEELVVVVEGLPL